MNTGLRQMIHKIHSIMHCTVVRKSLKLKDMRDEQITEILLFSGLDLHDPAIEVLMRQLLCALSEGKHACLDADLLDLSCVHFFASSGELFEIHALVDVHLVVSV